jgi:adenosylhomocysteine nucleosidase
MEEYGDMREVAVFTALRAETNPLKALLSQCETLRREIPIHCGELEGKRVILVCSGMGKESSLAAAEFVYSKYNPHAVLSTGFCGGLVPQLSASDVVLCSWIVTPNPEAEGDWKRIPTALETRRLQEALDAEGVRAYTGGLVSMFRPVVVQDERTALASRSGAMAVDMETFHLGEFFINRKVPFVAMRVVLDTVQDNLPVVGFKAMAGGRAAILRHLLFGKSDRDQLWQFYRNGRQAQACLRKSVTALMRVWPG